MESDARKRLIRAAFDGAREYDCHAELQRTVAMGLVERLSNRPGPRAPAILEIGCGTGYLSREILRLFPAAKLLCTDLSPLMLSRAREKLAATSARFEVMDGEAPHVEGPFDLLISSLAFQWFEHLPDSLRKLSCLVAPGGTFAFASLARGTFAEWRAAHDELGLPSGSLRLPESAWFREAFSDNWKVDVEKLDLKVEYPSVRAFLASLRGVGASVPASGYQGLKPHEMRRLLAHCDQGPGFVVTWEIVFVLASPCF